MLQLTQWHKSLKTIALGFFLSISSLTQVQALEVTSSFSILSDLIQQVGGDKVQVHTIVQAGQDMHGHQLSPSNIKQMQKSTLVFVNGLGFDSVIEKAARNQKNTKIVVVSQGITQPHSKKEEDHDHHGHDDHKHGHDDHKHGHDDHNGLDPHAWQNPTNAIVYIQNITKALCTAEPANCAYFQQRASSYTGVLQGLQKDIAQKINSIPAEKRHLLTTHQAFDYYAEAFGLNFYGIQGIDPHGAEISPKQLVDIIKNVQKNSIKAVFYENQGDRKLAETIAKNAKIALGGQLYSDTLSKDASANTYLNMMRNNTETILKGLR